MYTNILVAIDGSDTAEQALTQAIDLAKALGSRIRLVHVATESDSIPADLPGVDIQAILQHVHDSGAAILARARDRVSTAGVAVETRLVEAWSGQPGEEVIQQARQWPADLIVCGTHGRRGLRRILMGSDAEFVLRHTPVPVLLVRAQTMQERP